MNLSVLALILQPIFILGSNNNINYLRSNNLGSKEVVKKKLSIQNDEKVQYNAVVSSYANGERTEYNQIIEFHSSTNSLSINDNIYSLNNIEEYFVWSSNNDNEKVKVYLDGIDLTKESHGRRVLEEVISNKPTFYFGKIDNEIELLISESYDRNRSSRRIDTIEIYNVSNRVSTTLMFDDDDIVDDTPINYLNNTNYLQDSFYNTSEQESSSSTLYNDTIEDYGLSSKEIQNQTELDSNIFQSQGSCGVYRQIEVAIAFDTSFCKYMGGFNAAVKRVQTIVSLASNRYHQAGLCLSIKLKAIDGRCKKNSDPYSKMVYWFSGCLTSYGFYPEFASYFHSKMNHIPRDAAHLFTAHAMDGPLGCSGLGSLCNYAYGVEQMNFAKKNDVTLPSSLFAHELGHNCGASHYDVNGFIMNAAINQGQYGFSAQSMMQMNSYLNTVSCLSYTNS